MTVDIALSNRGLQIWAGWDARPSLPAIDCPALVMGGRWDYIVPPKQARILAEALGNSTYVEWDDCGHFMWLERPERFFATLSEWLAETSPAA